jgi:hypothetical protein
LLNAAGPQGGMLELGLGEMSEHLGANRVGIAIGQRCICVIALHFG